jgi:ankyrin repeat protein
VKFHVEYICQQSTRRQIKEALVKLKRSSTEKRPLDPTYDRAMKSIHEKPESLRELAIKILSWLVHAQRTLTVKEVQTAVSVELYRYDIDEKDLPDRATLLEVCASLVTIDDHGTGDIIRLAHYTVQEYLQEKSIIPGDAAFTIAMTCLTFLSFDTFSSGACESKNSIKERLQTYPFFEYAALNLSSHLHKCGELGDSAVDILLRFLANPGSTSSYLQVVYLWRRDYWEGDHDDFEKYPKGCLPLHVASILGVCEVIRVLIEGADFSIPKNTGWEKVYKAASRGHSSVVQLLLEKKANVAMKSGEDGLTALHMAAGHGHEAAIKLLHELGADISGEDEYGETALHVAAEYGHEAAVKLLLELGADISKKSGGLGDTALHIAASFEHVGVVQLLLEKGARISEKNKEGRTALHLAVEYDLEEVVKLLLERGAYADIWGKDADGKTALDLAAEAEYEGVESAHGDVFEILLEHIADTTSHTATEGWYEVATKLLLERGVADISNIDKFRRTALHIAAEIGHEVAIRLLLEQGADISIKNILGDTALHIAASFEHVGVVQLLLEKGASISETNDKGRTALHLAAEYGARGVVGLLLERGVDIWEKDADGKTALDVAAESEYGGRALVILLEHAADTSEDGDRGNTALHTAAEMGYEAAIKLLLELGADIFEKNGYGETALHMATKNGHEAAVKLLLELEADILEKDNIGHAASEIAERKGNSEMVELGNAEN